MKKDRNSRLRNGGGVLIIIILVLFAAGWPLENAATKGAESLFNNLFQDAEKAFGISIQYERASPSILGSLDLFSLSLAADEERNLLRAGRLNAAYSLPLSVKALLGHENVGGALERITVKNVSLSLDMEKDSDLVQSFRSALSRKPSVETVPQPAQGLRSLEISVRRLKMDVRDPARGAVWTAQIRSLDLVLSDREIFLALDGSLSGVLNRPGLPVQRVTVPVVLKGSTNKDFTTARFSVSLAGRSDVGILEPQEFTLLLKDGIFEARKVRDEAPFDLYVRYDTESGTIDAETRFESLSLTRLGRPAGRYGKTLLPWFRGPYTGSASLNVPRDWRDARFTADLAGTLPRGFLGDNLSFLLSAYGSPGSIQLRKLDISSRNGSVRLSGKFQPDGASIDLKAAVDYRALNGRLPLAANISAVGEGSELFLYSEKPEIGGARFGDLAVFATRGTGSIDFRGGVTLPDPIGERLPAAFSDGKAAEKVDRGITWEGAVALGKTPFFECMVEIDPYELGPLAPLFRISVGSSVADALDAVSVGGRFTLSSDFSRFSYSATDFRIARAGADGEKSYAVLNLSGNADSLNVSRFLASFGGHSLEGSLDADFVKSGGLSFRTNFSMGDIPYSLEGEYGDSRLRVSGDYGFYLAASRAESGINGRLRVQALPLALKDGVLLATVEVDAELRSSIDWKAEVSRMELEPSGSLKGRIPSLRLSGSVGPQGAVIPSLHLADARSSLSGAADFVWDLGNPENPVKAEAALSGGTGEAVRVAGVYEAGKIDGRAEFQSFSVSWLFGEDVTGSLTGNVRAFGEARDPRADFAFSLKDGAVRRTDIAISAEGSVDRRGLVVRDGSGRYGKHRAQAVQGSVNFDTGKLSVLGEYAGSLAEETVRFDFRTSGELSMGRKTPDGLPDFSKILENASMNGSVAEFSMGKHRADYWPFSIGMKNGELDFRGGESSEVSVKILDDGSFLAKAVPPFPLSALVVGKVSDRQIAMDLSDIRMEMNVLWPFIPLPDIHFLTGTATGELSVRGNSSDPEIYGSLRFQDATLEVPNYVNAPIGPITAPLEANGRLVTLIQPVIGVGQNSKASVALSFEMSQWIPRSFSLRARSLESTQIPLTTKFLGLAVNGAADADITLTAEENLLGLSGTLIMPRAEIVVDPSVAQGGKQDGPVPRTNTKIDLAVKIGKGVTVYFPSKEFPVIIGQADPSSQLQVSYDDRDQAFALKGNAVLRGGNLFYIQKNFYLKSGKMIFNENQYSFDPRVTLEAELRTRKEGESVKITLRAENQSLINLKPTLESTPSLTQAEIASLLGSDLIASEDGSDIDIRRTLIASTDIIPQLNFVNVFERNTRQLLGLDIFYLKTEIVQRWLLDVAKLDTSIDTEVSLADYLDNTSVFAGKYITDDVFFHAMLQLQQENPLVNKSSLRLDSEIGFELTTPFFLFDWSLALLHPEDLFVSDNSFSFTWRLSY